MRSLYKCIPEKFKYKKLEQLFPVLGDKTYFNVRRIEIVY